MICEALIALLSHFLVSSVRSRPGPPDSYPSHTKVLRFCLFSSAAGAQSKNAALRRRRSLYAKLQSCENHVRHERRFSRQRLDEHFRSFVTGLAKFRRFREPRRRIQSFVAVAGRLPAQGLGRADSKALDHFLFCEPDQERPTGWWKSPDSSLRPKSAQ